MTDIPQNLDDSIDELRALLDAPLDAPLPTKQETEAERIARYWKDEGALLSICISKCDGCGHEMVYTIGEPMRVYVNTRRRLRHSQIMHCIPHGVKWTVIEHHKRIPICHKCVPLILEDGLFEQQLDLFAAQDIPNIINYEDYEHENI